MIYALHLDQLYQELGNDVKFTRVLGGSIYTYRTRSVISYNNY